MIVRHPFSSINYRACKNSPTAGIICVTPQQGKEEKLPWCFRGSPPKKKHDNGES
jgi:hypothetical protein